MLNVGIPHGVHLRSFLPIRNSMKMGDALNRHVFLRFDRIARNSFFDRARPRKCFWSGALSYVYPGDTIMLSTPAVISSSKCALTLFGSAPSKSVVLVVTRKPA